MNFVIDSKPPTSEAILEEQRHISEVGRRIKTRDTVISFILILITSGLIGAAVYWSTMSFVYAAVAFSVFPTIGVILGLAGLITVIGFRSNAKRVIELKHELIALSPVSSENENEIRKLRRKYPQVERYCRQVEKMGRALVNGELALFWEWDATTQAKHAKQRAYLNDAGKESPPSNTSAA